MEHMNKRLLFNASCMALLVTSMTFAIRAGMLNQLGIDFGLNFTELQWIAGTAFWGFPLAVIVGGYLADKIGMGRLLWIALFCHVLGILLTIFSVGFWTLFFSTLLIGIANGTVEAACNPLIATIYPENKTTKLNHFHLWFPGGIVIGSLVVFFFTKVGLNWQWQMATMLLPAAFYGWMFFGQKFPETERVAQGVSEKDMWSSIFSPLFIFIIICMFGTAVTELGTNQWIDVLLRNVTSNAILLLLLISGIMAVGRGFAGPVVHRFSPPGVLFVSAILSAIGLYMLSTLGGGLLFVAAAIFAVGVTYFWPTMLGFVSEYIPKSGAMGLALTGAAGMFATSVFFYFLGSTLDTQILEALPSGADLGAFRDAETGSPDALVYAEAQLKAGPYILRRMAIIPTLLIIAFGGLYFLRHRLKTSAEQLSLEKQE
jgi:MFS family permease